MASRQSHLTLRSSTPGGPRRLHNDNLPSGTSADFGPLISGDLAELGDDAEAFLNEQYGEDFEPAAAAFRLWADVSSRTLVDTDDADFGQFQDEWPGEAAAFIADQYPEYKHRDARTAFALWSDLRGWNPLTAREEDCFAFLDNWPGTYGSDEEAKAAYADNSDDDPTFDPGYFDDNYEVHELNGQFINPMSGGDPVL